MLNRTRFVLLGTVGAFALSACAYLSGQNQSCPPVQEISDPMTAALPPMPKPPPKEEYEPTAASTETAPVAQADDAGAAATGDSGAIATATAPDAGGGKPKTPVATSGGGGGGGAPACGDKANPCPLQKFMRTTMAGAASDPAALQGAFTKLAGLSPNGGWAWRSIAQKGADAAKAGDVAEAKKQCKACHDQYREQYKQQYRARKF
jgi:hypothetical protein